jgi:hypothetical protein
MPLSLIVFAVLFVFFFAFEWRLLRTLLTQDPEWKREIRGTPWRDRRRIARAVRDGRRLDNPRDARLAVGMAEQRLLLNRSTGRLTRWLMVALGIGLILLGRSPGAHGDSPRGLLHTARADDQGARGTAAPPNRSLP